MHPILFKAGAFCIYTYGVMVALGALLAGTLCVRHAQREGISREKMTDLIFWILLGGIVGARLFYVMLHLDYFSRYPLEIIMIHKGGLVYYGGFIFGTLTGIFFSRRVLLPLLTTMDLIAVYVPLAHAFGRIGCFFNGCCYGTPTESFLGVTFPNHFVKVLPTQLIEALLLVVVFIFLARGYSRRRFEGQIFALYLMAYGVLRFNLEFIRGDTLPVAGPFTVFQLISFGLLAIGLGLYHFLGKEDA